VYSTFFVALYNNSTYALTYIVPFSLISTVQAVNWQRRKAEFVKNVKYFL